MEEQDRCWTCGGAFVETESTPGYGEDAEGFRHCYGCCALLDKETMRRAGQATLYLSGQPYKISNWPGTLTIAPTRVKRSVARCFGRAIDRYDVWFEFEGTKWHGVNLGDNQIVRCRRLACT